MSFAFVRGFKQRGAQDAQTPDWLWALLEDTFGPVWDPCPRNPRFDGLAVDWKATARRSGKRQAYVNPEFKNIPAWLNKALAELEEQGFPSIFLIPFRPHTKYFAELIVPNAREIRILSRHVAFKGFKEIFPQRLCVVVFGKPQRSRTANLLDTRPLYIDSAMAGLEWRHVIAHYTKARRSNPIDDPQNVPQIKRQLHAIANGNQVKWLRALQETPHLDIYSMLNERSRTFVRLLLEPNATAVVFMPPLKMDGGSRINAFGSWVILGKPKPSAKLSKDYVPLPPTVVWEI